MAGVTKVEQVKDLLLAIERDLAVATKLHTLHTQLAATRTDWKERTNLINRREWHFITYVYNLAVERSIINLNELLEGTQITLKTVENIDQKVINDLQGKYIEISNIRNNFLAHKNKRIPEVWSPFAGKANSRYLQLCKNCVCDIRKIDTRLQIDSNNFLLYDIEDGLDQMITVLQTELLSK